MTMMIFSGGTVSWLILMRMGTLLMQILQDNQLMESPNEKIGINDIMEC